MAGNRPDSASTTRASVDPWQLIDAHGERLLRSAYLLCGNETEAQDLVQETLLQALKSAQRFRGESSTYTWLYGILRNLYYRFLRRQGRFVFEEEKVLEEPSQPATNTESDQAFCAAKLAQGLQSLSPEHRDVVVLRYYENLKLHEIANRTGVSVGTVKSRLHYAMRCLAHVIPSEMNLFVSEDTHNQVAP